MSSTDMDPSSTSDKKIDVAEVAKHNSKDSCWVTLYGKVYDVTDFLDTHPGGPKSILNLAGKDATEEYDPIHPPGLLEETLTPKQFLGEIDVTTIPKQLPLPPPPAPPSTPITSTTTTTPSSPSPATEPKSQEAVNATVPVLAKPPAALPANYILPPLEAQLNLEDFTTSAKNLLSAKAWAYYSSAADDLHTLSLNNKAYTSILLRPRIFRNVEKVDTSLTLLKQTPTPQSSSLPVFVSPAAMARLAHPDGESAIAKACGKQGIVQIVSNNASQTFETIAAAKVEKNQPQWFQLYVQSTLAKSEAVLKRVNELGYTAIVLTLDAPTPGKREADERVRNLENATSAFHAAAAATTTTEPPPPAAPSSTSASKNEGLGRALFAGTSPTLTWNDLFWLRQHTPLPIILKGLQTHEDALIASQNPLVSGIILSNHGGRSLDTAPPAVYTLMEIRKYCPEVFERVDVYVDGGIKRGTDVVKALCLGAKAVGIGRPALFALAGYGEGGVGRVIEILREEIETCMRLLGVNSLSELGPRYVNARALDHLIYQDPDYTPAAAPAQAPVPPLEDLEVFKPKAKL